MNLTTIPITQLHRHLGATVGSSPDRQAGTCRFAVWAPTAKRIEVDLCDQQRVVKMHKRDGFHVVDIDDVLAGQRYGYRIDGGPTRPDPASRFQPTGVHGRYATATP